MKVPVTRVSGVTDIFMAIQLNPLAVLKLQDNFRLSFMLWSQQL